MDESKRLFQGGLGLLLPEAALWQDGTCWIALWETRMPLERF